MRPAVLFPILMAAVMGLESSAVAEAREAARQVPSFDECLDSGDARLGMMRAIFACYTEEFSRKDDTLNKHYRAIMRTLDSTDRQKLKILERRWIADRDRICETEARTIGGQDGEISGRGCLISETDKRIEWLKSWSSHHGHVP